MDIENARLQLNSLDNQIDYYKDMIEKNNNWECSNAKKCVNDNPDVFLHC